MMVCRGQKSPQYRVRRGFRRELVEVLFDRLNRIGVTARLKFGECKEGQIPVRMEARIKPHCILYGYNCFISTSRELQVVT